MVAPAWREDRFVIPGAGEVEHLTPAQCLTARQMAGAGFQLREICAALGNAQAPQVLAAIESGKPPESGGPTEA